MSVLGPISTMTPADPSLYLDLDFSKGFVPPELIYTRSSNQGVWDKEGKYRVVAPNEPPITWVPELGSYALALEIASSNYIRTSANRPLGLNFGPGATLVEGIDAPDGSKTAIRATGTWQGAVPAEAHAIPSGKSFINWIFYWRPVDNTSICNTRYYTSSPANSWLLGFRYYPLTGVIAYDSGPVVNHKVNVVKRIDGWLEFSGTLAIPDNAVSISVYTEAPIGTALGTRTPGDYWYPQLSESSVPSSLILPSTSVQARTNYSAHVMLDQGREILTGVGLDLDTMVAKGDMEISGSCPWAVTNATGLSGTRMMNSIVSKSTMGVQLLVGTNTAVTQAAFVDTMVGLGKYRVKSAVSNFPSGTKSSVNNASVTSTPSNKFDTSPITRLNFGAYLQNNFSFYLSRARVYRGPFDPALSSRL